MPLTTRTTFITALPFPFSARRGKNRASRPGVYSRRMRIRDTTWSLCGMNHLSYHAPTRADVPERVDDLSASRRSPICRSRAGTVKRMIFNSSQNDFFRT